MDFIQAIWLDKTLPCQSRAGDFQALRPTVSEKILKIENKAHRESVDVMIKEQLWSKQKKHIMQFERIKLEFVDRVAFLTLNHPETLNAISIKMILVIHKAKVTSF